MHLLRFICPRAGSAAVIVAALATCLALAVITIAATDDAASNDAASEGAASEGAPVNVPAEADGASPAQAQRVILRVNRNSEVRGQIEFEDHDVIVVRTLRGETESFTKIRVLQIVRLVDPEPGQAGVVYLRNGQSRAGIILEDSFDYVLVEIEGIPAKLRREFVDHVVLEPTFEQRYAEIRQSLRPNMHERHLALVRWLIEQRRYDLARENLQELLLEADSYEARRLLRLVDAQLALQAAADEPAAIESETEEDASPEQPLRRPAKMLTHEDVNLIRVYEIDFNDPPRLTVRPETARQLFESYGTHQLIPASQSERNALLRGDSAQLVRLMFELRARELYPQIEVNSEPASLNHFRLRVHNNWLLNNCATSGCHGGPDAGQLQLHRRGYVDDRVRYTNFMILENLEVDPEWPLINYDNPEMSLIIQHGLPRNAARKPHPDVRGWTPVFNRRNDRMLEETIHWIGMMMQPRPEYPIEFDPRPWFDESAIGPDDEFDGDTP